jgi:hypothetical protein
MTEQRVWLLITIACLVWYTSITVYIAWRGAIDIRQMLSHLAKGNRDPTKFD